MGLIGLLIVAVIIALIFTFTYYSNSQSTITPQNPKQIESNAQSAVNAALEKSKQEQTQAKELE